MTIYLFDGTMDGLLTAVFDAFSLKEQPEELLTEGDALPRAIVHDLAQDVCVRLVTRRVEGEGIPVYRRNEQDLAKGQFVPDLPHKLEDVAAEAFVGEADALVVRVVHPVGDQNEIR